MKKKTINFLKVITSFFLAIIFFSIASAEEKKDSIYSYQINVPLDYGNPKLGSFKLYYEFGDPFNPNKPTIIVVSDAQQFYIRKGSVKKLQNDLFGEKFNVVGIVNRASVESIRKLCFDSVNNNINWELAYKIYNSKQYVHDIESVRKRLLGNSKVYLYGVSGGGFLTVEYLSVFPDNVSKAFIGSATNYHIESLLGIKSDNFWKEFVLQDSVTTSKMLHLLQQNSIDRFVLGMLFQRQIFFVRLDSLNYSRKKLLNDLLLNDTALINHYLEEYQLTYIANFLDSDFRIPIKVREFEFIQSILNQIHVSSSEFNPDYEHQYFVGKPLVDAYNNGQIKFKTIYNKSNLQKSNVEIFIQSGRYDHDTDYRTQIYLAGQFKNSVLFIADDDHTFKQLKKENVQSPIIIEFFTNGMNNQSTRINWLYMYEQYKWKEN